MRDFEYTIKNAKRSKSLKITIYKDGHVTVTKPWWVSKKIAELYIRQKLDWINIQRGIYAHDPYNILGKGGKEDYKKKKEEARILVYRKLAQWNALYSFEYKKVAIRNQRTRWGSCSSRKTLSFNYKIIYLNESLQDYLIVHELCHLAEMNHGKKFWNLVESTIPDYKKLRTSLHKDM